MGLQKFVTPVKTCVQYFIYNSKTLGSGFCRKDEMPLSLAFVSVFDGCQADKSPEFRRLACVSVEIGKSIRRRWRIIIRSRSGRRLLIIIRHLGGRHRRASVHCNYGQNYQISSRSVRCSNPLQSVGGNCLRIRIRQHFRPSGWTTLDIRVIPFW
jgi:hypothetical protein